MRVNTVIAYDSKILIKMRGNDFQNNEVEDVIGVRVKLG